MAERHPVIGDAARLPRLPKRSLERPGLMKRLDGWAPVTVVRGLQGYGKTTLVASWLEARPADEVTVIWVSAGVEAQFDAQLDDELDVLGVARTEARTEARTDGRVVDVRRWPGLARLNGLLSTVRDRRVVLAVDHVEDVGDRATVSGLVDLAARYRHFHVMVCCRGRHPIESVASSAVETCVIAAGDLLLSVEEIVELSEVMDRPIGIRQARQLHDALGGWVSALRLVLDAYEGTGPLPIAAGEEYLRTVVLPGMGDQALLESAMQFSLAGRLEHRLVRDLSEEPDRTLSELEMRGFFERAFEGERVMLHQPDLVRAVLADTYTSREPEAARRFHRRLAAWFETSGDGDDDIELALDHAIAGHDWTVVTRLWTEHGPRLASRDPARNRAWLQALPPETLEAHPILAVARASAEVLVAADGDQQSWRAATRAYLDASGRMVRVDDDALEGSDLLAVRTAHLVALRLSGRLAEAEGFALKLGAETAERTAAGDAISDEQLGWLHLQRGLAHTLAGSDDVALGCYRRAWQTADRSTTAHVRAGAAACLALAHVMRGDAALARDWLGRHRQLDAAGPRACGPANLGARVAEGVIALDRLDAAAAEASLAGVARDSPLLELWPYTAYLAGQHALHFGRPAEGLSVLDEIEAAHAPAGLERGAAEVLLARVRADLLIACGQAQRALELIDARGANDGRSILEVARARILLLAGEPAQARMVAARASDDGADPRARLELLVIEALATLRMDEPEAAGRLAAQAMGLCRQTGILRALTTIPGPDLVELCGGLGPDGHLEHDARSRLARAPVVYPEHVELVRLTRREQSVLAVLARTGSRRDIADELFVSVNTIKAQVHGLYRKLGATTREQALLRAQQLGLLSRPRSGAE